MALPPPLPRLPASLRRWLVLLLVLSPGWVSALYLIGFATPQYGAEASFVVRAAAGTATTGGLARLLSSFGLGQAHDNAFTVQEFMLSRDAVQQLQQRIGLRDIYAGPRHDPHFRFPSLLNGSSDEHLWRYYRRMTEVVFNTNTGITVIRARAFAPDQARGIAEALLEMGEQMVNAINQRQYDDAVRLALQQLARAEARVAAAQAALSAFRARELTLDPSRGATMVMELIGRLNAELATVRAQLAETRSLAANSPAIAALQGRAAALAAQIAEERARAAGSEDGLTRQLGEFDRLNLEREFANRLLASALQAFQLARLEAQRQQLFLERVAQPSLPDYAAYPEVTRWVATNMALNLILAMIGWLITVGAREHRRGLQVRRRA